jgi:hypothetical protein
MSLELGQGTHPHGLRVKAHGREINYEVWIGDYEISLEDFLAAAAYVLVNTDLQSENDPRLKFIDDVAALQQKPGFNAGQTRLEGPTFAPMLKQMRS